MSSAAERLYEKLPHQFQNVAVSLYGYSWRHRRLGGRFEEYRDGFARRMASSAAAARKLQDDRFREILALAWNAPYYREHWTRAGLDPSGELALADLQQLPIVTKDAVRERPRDFCVGGTPARGAVTSMTSGSTGTSLTLWDSSDDFRRAFALRDAYYDDFAGVNYRMPRGTFSGRRVEPAPDSDGPYHRYNLAERQIYFSPYHLGPNTVAQYIAAIVKHNPRWLTGYATCLADLAHLSLERGIECPPLRAVITAAEPVPDQLRVDSRIAFGCRVTEEYGLAEQVCFALECERGSLHLAPEAGFVEILNEDGEPCVPGEVGEIVATGFLRETQPFVRYRTGDLAALATSICECGRGAPVLARLEGRVDDYVIGADGRRVGRLSHVPKGLPGVLAMQFVQRRPGEISAHVVCEHELDPGVAATIRERLHARLGEATEVQVRQVSSLSRTERGKIRGVIRETGQDAGVVT